MGHSSQGDDSRGRLEHGRSLANSGNPFSGSGTNNRAAENGGWWERGHGVSCNSCTAEGCSVVARLSLGSPRGSARARLDCLQRHLDMTQSPLHQAFIIRDENGMEMKPYHDTALCLAGFRNPWHMPLIPSAGNREPLWYVTFWSTSRLHWPRSPLKDQSGQTALLASLREGYRRPSPLTCPSVPRPIVLSPSEHLEPNNTNAAVVPNRARFF